MSQHKSTFYKQKSKRIIMKLAGRFGPVSSLTLLSSTASPIATVSSSIDEFMGCICTDPPPSSKALNAVACSYKIRLKSNLSVMQQVQKSRKKLPYLEKPLFFNLCLTELKYSAIINLFTFINLL